MDLPIVCFDMDGTLLDEAGCIHPNDVRLLASPQPPALFIPSTGRPTDSVRRGFARSGLFVAEPIPFPMVLQNGALLMEPGERTLAYERLEAGIQEQLLEMARGFPAVTCLFLSSTDIYVLWPNAFGLALAASFDFETRPLEQAAPGTPFSKVMCMSDSPELLAAIGRIVAAWPVESALSMPTILEITNYDINKGNGVKRLLKHIGRDGAPIYAAGDWGNDLPLFRIAAASFAPVTAPDTIKANASHVIDVRRAGLLEPILKTISA